MKCKYFCLFLFCKTTKVQWRKNRNEYVAKCKKLVEKANQELPGDVIIPHPDTNPEEKQKLVIFSHFSHFSHAFQFFNNNFYITAPKKTIGRKRI